MVASSVVPSPKPGRKTPIAVMRKTRYPTLPIQALTQYPQAEENPR